jgi:hypothetical protein
MAFRLTSQSDTTQQIRSIPISAATGTRANCGFVSSDAAKGDVTFYCSYYCEHDGTAGQFTIWETRTSGSAMHFALVLDCDGAGNYVARVNFKGASNVIGAGGLALTGIVPAGKWYDIAFAWQDRGSAIQDYVTLIVRERATGTVWKTGIVGNATASIGDPSHAAIGNHVALSAGNRNSVGICIPAIIAGMIFDGSTNDSRISENIANVATAGGIVGHISPSVPRFKTVKITGTPTGGTFALDYAGQVASGIAYNATATDVENALIALSNIAAGEVICRGGPLPGTAVTVQFNVASPGALTVSSQSFTGGSNPLVQVGSGVIWAANYVAANRDSSADSREGKSLTTTNMYGCDVNLTSQPNHHQAAIGCAVTGTITAVNPYDYGSATFPPPTDTTVGSESLPATSLTLAASGRRGPKLTKLANWINDGTGSGQLRVGIFGNSRAVYTSQYPLQLSDGTFPGRTVKSNFADAGIIGQAGLWNNGRIIGGLFPVPTCQWSGTDQLEGAYGADCSAALPRCLSAVPAPANPSAVFTSLVNSTLGSRFCLTSRTATTVPSSAGSPDNYRGPGGAVRLNAGCTYRIMIREEAGLPVTEPLTVKLHILNHPTHSPITAARKVIGSGQNNAEDSSSAVTFPALGLYPMAKDITAVTTASLTSQVTQSTYGSITVDDTDNGFATLAVGDMMQLADPLGETNVYNEAWIVRTVTNKGQINCTITYEWLPRQAPAIGDKVTYIKADNILKTVTATFAAGEADPGKWRGIEITADAFGDGVLLWGLEFVNPSRDGVFVVPLGRSGCGAWIQAARWPRIEDAGGVSLNERIFQTLDLDVFVATTADQGTAGGHYVASYDTLIDYIQADTPSTDIVLYSTGPEWTSETNPNKVDAGDKFDWTAVMQHSASSAGVPHTAFLFSRYTSAFGRITVGDDTTEGPVHPGTVRDIAFFGEQLGGLEPTPEANDFRKLASRDLYSPRKGLASRRR